LAMKLISEPTPAISAPMISRWIFGFNNRPTVPARMVNATNLTLDLTSIQFTNAGLYSVVVSSPLGSATNTPEQVVVNPAGISLGLYPGITINGVVGYIYSIQSTANLSDTNSWVTLTNLTLTQPIQIWVDTSTEASLPGNPQRFYRVLPGP
jgi:hypothetical protein